MKRSKNIEDFPIVGRVRSERVGQMVPLLDIPMMSDYKWQLSCYQSRIENREDYERLGEDVDMVLRKLEKWLSENKPEEGVKGVAVL